MRKILCVILTIASAMTVLGQTTSQKTVIITEHSKKVPVGKKWILEANKETKVQLSDEVFESGDRCNALFLSNPKIVMSINKGDFFHSDPYTIIFKDPEKVPYTNSITYTLTPISFGDKNFSVFEFQSKKPEEVGVKKLEFKSGESVFVGNCLQSIELIEVDMTTQEVTAEKKKQDELKKAELEKTNNFCIPINPDSRPEPGTKPMLKDSLIKYVVFECHAVLFHTRSQRGGLDDVHQWTITLTQNIFEMKSSNIDRKYSVIGAKYDEQLLMQEFQLADDTGGFIYKVNLQWDKIAGYQVQFSSLDYKEDFQFQRATVKEIQYQNK